jgi:glycosyltransferase involved in cell wall biosynthesis
VARAQHIVIIFHDFSFGGTEVIALRLAREWVAQGRRVTLLCGTFDGPLRSAVPRGVHTERLEPEIPRTPLSRLRLRRALLAAIARLRPDVVFLPGNFHHVLAGAVRDLPRRPKVVAKISNPLAPSAIPALRALLARAFRWAARDVDWFAAMSTGLADDVRALTGRAEVSVIFDPNIDTIINLPAARKVPGTGPLHLLAAGRLVEQKDFGLAVRVVAELAKHRDVRLTIAGDGPGAPRLARLARRLGVADRIALPGRLASIGPALDHADLLLITSRYEGGPAVAVEALERGVPVIATDCSHFLRDLLADADCGAIVPSREPAAIAEAMLEWIDRQDRRPFSPAVVTEPFGTAFAARRYLDLFDRLAGEDGCAAPVSRSTPPRTGSESARRTRPLLRHRVRNYRPS